MAPLPEKTQPELKPTQTPSTTMPPTKILETIRQFQLPNSKVGTPYREKIECTNAQGILLEVVDIRFPDELAGLKFDLATQTVHGELKTDGEFSLSLLWRDRNHPTEKKSGSCNFVVIADPRSLWKCLEPDKSLPYHKEHLAALRFKNLPIAAASRRGRSHEHAGSFRDDDFWIKHLENGWNILIVADGAGSADKSREGSRIAVTTAGEVLEKDFQGEVGQKITALHGEWEEDEKRKVIYNLVYASFQKAAGEAIQAIKAEAEKEQVSVKNYATTLLAALTKQEGEHLFLNTFWMGDGAIAAYGPKGTVTLMGTPDSGEYAGQTRFLDTAALHDPEFHKRINVRRLANLQAVLLMTDGVSDPYFETDNGLNDPAKWDALWAEIQPLLNKEKPEEALLDWLHFFTPGHHDDRTIAVQWFQQESAT
jgi:serine/threonine protein phosphatase PrpC